MQSSTPAPVSQTKFGCRKKTGGGIIAWLVSHIAWLYLHFAARTSKIRWLNIELKNQFLERNENFIYAFWHGRQMMLTWTHRNSSASVLVSQSKDGEYIARTIHLFGMGTVRGSSSRGGAKALVELKHTLESGRSIGITPDGPRGPQRQIQSGVLFLAQKTGKAILPVTCSFKRKIVFKGWDDYWFPLPFNSIQVSYGNPITISPNDDIEKKSSELSNELNRITDEADRIVSGEQ